MYKILILLIVISLNSYSQTPVTPPPGGGYINVNPAAVGTIHNRIAVGQALGIPTVSGVPTQISGYDLKQAQIIHDSTGHKTYIYDPALKTFTPIGTGSGSSIDTLFSDPFTTDNSNIGFDPGDSLSAAQLIQKVFYGIQKPTGSLSGGTTLELTGASTVSSTLSWTAGRGINTPTLTSIVVGGVTQTFSQPGPNGSVSGTQGISVPANVSTPFYNIVTASDGQISTFTTQYNFLPRMYYGWINDTTGILSGSQDATIRALADQPLTTSKSIPAPGFSRPISGVQYFVIAYPANEGTLTSIKFNGFESKDAMNSGTHIFTNGQGFTQSYQFYWNKLAQNTTSTIIAE